MNSLKILLITYTVNKLEIIYLQINIFTKGSGYSQYTLAFFNYTFESIDEILEKSITINLVNN